MGKVGKLKGKLGKVGQLKNVLKKQFTSPPFQSDIPALDGKGIVVLKDKVRAILTIERIWSRKEEGEFPGQMQVACRTMKDWLAKQK